ncbi:cyclophilin-type peptidyl-prolyl cis-trans isomerase [Angomonas deanei]|nr:cyclophilin-type peptidyl-prolyl cis-trans isomerase [Angomonas deanei]|eukprot:EPY38691.1 cyclophilin-type peptidyl-prolyl cis-trans isomerase [Angomonas deanei]
MVLPLYSVFFFFQCDISLLDGHPFPLFFLTPSRVLDRRLPMTEDDDVDWERLNKNMRDVEERRYKEWENYQKSHRNMEDQQNCAFIDLSIDNALAGRFELTLFESQVPNTVQHFRSLLSGTMGVDEERGIKLDYYGTSVRSIDKEKGIIVLGDFGSLGISVKPIPDENFSVRHGERGLLTMMSSGPNTGSTAFGILLKPAPSLDYTQVVFGKITDGFSLLERLETLPVNNIGKPLNAVSIALCGVLSGKAPRHGDGN